MASADNGLGDGWTGEPIAIIGMSAKFSGDATNYENLWRMLVEGRSGWTPFPASRFRSEGVYHPNNQRLNNTHVKGAHFLEEDVGLFDAAFFGYSSETASSVDPQYRLQLESAYEALENAGLLLSQITGSNTSVYTGVFVHDYRDGLLRDADNLPRLMATGTGVPMMSNRISHFFDLRGPSMTIETACSSGMVATHQGVQSLRSGEADMSIVGGANLTLNPDMFKALGSAGFLSADGKSYAFDSRASGYGRGEGVGTLILKRLKDARAAGDPIRAVIRESLLNQDGKTETITTPSLEAQEALLRDCYRKAGLNTRDTQYFEAHGTGTQAGDTVEARAIANVFASHRNPLLIGSVKTNLGHTEAASGLASIVKTALALEKGVVPPSINFEKPNPKIALEEWNLKLVRKLEDWPATSIRRASINNFGYGGANAHIILEDGASWVPATTSRIEQPNGHVNGFTNGHSNGLANGHTNERSNGHSSLVSNGGSNGHSNGHTNGHHIEATSSPQASRHTTKVLILSGKDEQACQNTISNLADYLKGLKTSTLPESSESLLSSLAYTLGERRTRFPWLAAHPVSVTEDIDEVIQVLESPKFKPSRSARKPRIGMVFTGQGAQWHAMGRELVDAYPVYKDSLLEAEGYLEQFGADWSLMEELSRDAEVSRINEVALSTTICVAVQISLVRLLRAWEIEPVAVTSHSSGEIAAAYTVGALSYRAALAYSYHRALLAADKSLRGPVKGGMIAVGLALEDTESYINRLKSDGQVVVACINSPSSITVSGDLSAVIELEDLATAEGVFARRLKVDTAWHSHHMASIAKVYSEALGNMQTDDNRGDALNSTTFSSPVTGGRVTSARQIASPDHWIKSLLQPVQFVAAFKDMVLAESGSSSSNIDVIIEVGPHTALGSPIQQILALPEFKDLQLPYCGTLVRKTDARDSMQALAASLLQEGYPVDMGAVNFPHGRQRQVKVLTDLPSYPWNHQIKHWVEPRFNKALRERSQPAHDLLGSLVEGCNPDTPSWRHTLRISESPWTRDHAIQSNIVYPAAGYICLAIEALKQITTSSGDTSNSREVSGYRLRDVDFLQALMIPDTSDGIEIQTTLRSVGEKDISARGFKHFEVWTVTADNRWTQHAKGLVSVEFEGSTLEASTPITSSRDIKGFTRRIIPSDLFSNLRALGIAHGPMFQNMKRIVQSGSENRSIVTMAVADTSVPNDLVRDQVLHPVTLDSIITASYSAVPGAASREVAAKVPRSVDSFWVSSKISHEAGHLFNANSSLIRDDSQGMAADVSVSDDESGNVVLEMKSFSYQSLGKSPSFQKSEPWEKELCTKIDWSLDISFSSLPATFAGIKKRFSFNIDSAEIDLTRDVWRVCIYFIQRALHSLEQHEIESLNSHQAKYYAWLKHTVEQAASGELCVGSAEWMSDEESERQRWINQVAEARVDGRVISRLGPQLVAILRGQTTPLKVLVQEDNLSLRLYNETPRVKRIGSQLSGLLNYLAHKNPRARILEIGAGTGAITRYALDVLGTPESGGPRASLYHYTDISDDFFETIRGELSPWDGLLSFDKLDIERDPGSQGFINGSYDIVIASQVLHTTKSVSASLENVRSLLKPGGALLLAGDVRPQVDAQFMNRLSPSGWLGGAFEGEHSPLRSTAQLDESLQTAGFSGIEVELRDSDDVEKYTSVTILSTLNTRGPSRLTDSSKIAIVTSNKAGPPPAEWLDGLRASINESTQAAESELPPVLDLESASITAEFFADKSCIFVGEVEEPILYDLDAASLAGIRTISTNCKGLLWVTRGGAVDCERPELSLAPGFVRSLRNEYVGRKLLTLDLDPKGPLWSDAGVTAVVSVLQTVFGNFEERSISERGPSEFEYAERDGAILIPRLYHDVARDQTFSPEVAELETHDTFPKEPLYQPDRPLCLHPESLAFGDDLQANAYYEVLPPTLVEVEPRAYGANLRATDKHVTGLECAGIITRVGSEAATQGFAIGDRVVCLLGQSSFPSRAFVNWTSTAHIPVELSFQDAASLPVAFLTAYFSLVEIARLRRGQSVLIHSADTAVGQAAIMIAQQLGAEVFATVDGPDKRELIAFKYGIKTNHIFGSRDTGFGAATLAATNGRGVDVVLNSLAGPLLLESFNVVAPLGHFVEIGRRDLESNSNLEMRLFARSISFSAVDLPSLLEHKGHEVNHCLKEVVRLIEEKAVKPVHPVTAYAIGDVVEASLLLKTGLHTGSVVLSVAPNELVPVIPYTPAAKLNPEASYLIVGGNGGLGQSVAHWLVSRGARNLVLLSRSAATSENTAVLVEELIEAGCTRVLPVSCDVASEDDLTRAIDNCAQEGLPPIRGVIHAAFVLHDSFVEKMTVEDYKYTTQSKVAGAFNLHNQFNLPDDLDFFVLFSSINGILGYASQAAYSAAGAYEDALAHWRVKHCGLPGVSIDLSVVNAVGYVAEANASETLRKSLMKAGRRVIDEDHVLASLESAILSPYDPQFIVGGINSGPGPHWDVDGDLGRDMRTLSLKYRQPTSAAADDQEQGDRSDSLAAKMAACTTSDEAVRVVGSSMADMLADMFLVPAEEIDLSKSPSQQGIDSLVAVEVRNMLFSQAAAELSIFNIMQSPSLTALAADVVERSTHVNFVAATA